MHLYVFYNLKFAAIFGHLGLKFAILLPCFAILLSFGGHCSAQKVNGQSCAHNACKAYNSWSDPFTCDFYSLTTVTPLSRLPNPPTCGCTVFWGRVGWGRMVTFTGISTWANVLIFTRTSRVKLLMMEHGGTSYDDDEEEDDDDDRDGQFPVSGSNSHKRVIALCGAPSPMIQWWSWNFDVNVCNPIW